MNLQFNLLPEVKQQYLKAERTKRTVILSAFAASAISFFLLLFMMTNVYVVNKKKLSDADKNVQKYSDQLKNIPDLEKILTVQSQLKSVVPLHQSKFISSRIYTYLPQITPIKVCLGKVGLDLTNNSMTIDGTSNSLKDVNTYIDTLKFTTYNLNNEETKKKAFPTVIESQFGINGGGSSANATTCYGKPALANYQLTIEYDPALFANTSSVSLTVPTGLSTTRSVINDPKNTLFTGQTPQRESSSPSGSNSSGGSR
jgi:hypothetical protein